MTGIHPDTEPSARDADQRAVDEYFASQRFHERKVLDRNGKSWFGVGATSLVSGVLGLAAITLFFAVCLPVAMKIVQEVMPRRPTFPVMMAIIQTVLFPPLIAFSFATITPMFWHGSVVLRFLMAGSAVIPGYFGFMIAMLAVENGGPDDIWADVAVVLFSYFVATALVAVVVQMWSPWTMTHARTSERPLPPLGTRAIIELTGITAVGFAIFMAIDVSDVIEGVFMFAGFGLLACVGVISALIIYWRALKRFTLAAIVVGVFLFGAAFLVNGSFAAMEYGWDILSGEVLMISLSSTYGFALICAVGWLCLRWLRFCGWRCVNQKLEAQPDGLLETR